MSWFGSKNERAATGKAGEDIAAKAFLNLGWTILDRNWREGSLELDLVCVDADTLVFVEVKTRAAAGLASSIEALTPAKRGRLIRAARFWLSAHNAWERPCRFDLAAVTENHGHYHMEHIRHVIELGEREYGKGDRPLGRGNSTWQPW